MENFTYYTPTKVVSAKALKIRPVRWLKNSTAKRF